MYKLYRLLFLLSCCHVLTNAQTPESILQDQLNDLEQDCKGDSDCLEKIDNLKIAISAYAQSIKPMIVNGNLTIQYDQIPYKRKGQ